MYLIILLFLIILIILGFHPYHILFIIHLFIYSIISLVSIILIILGFLPTLHPLNFFFIIHLFIILLILGFHPNFLSFNKFYRTTLQIVPFVVHLIVTLSCHCTVIYISWILGLLNLYSSIKRLCILNTLIFGHRTRAQNLRQGIVIKTRVSRMGLGSFVDITIFVVKYYITRHLRRFAPIFYLNCEHVLFVYILKQRRKKFADF